MNEQEQIRRLEQQRRAIDIEIQALREKRAYVSKHLRHLYLKQRSKAASRA